MKEAGDEAASGKVLCLVVGDLSGRALARITERLAREGIEIVVEHRLRERRRGLDRRHGVGEGDAPGGGEKRRINSESGRRLGERRGSQLLLSAEDLALDGLLSRRERKALRFVRPRPIAEGRRSGLALTRLALKAQSGDVRAMENLIGRTTDFLYGRFLVATDDPDEAKDMTQEALTKLILGLPGYQFRHGIHFTAWLLRVGRSLIAKEMARRNVIERVPFDLAAHDHEAVPNPRLLPDPGASVPWIGDPDIQIAVRLLPEPQRRVLAMRYLFDCTPAQIADEFGTNAAAVAAVEYRAKSTLRARLSAAEGRRLRSRRLWSLRRVSPAPVMAARRFALAR